MTEDELGREALAFPDELAAWIGEAKHSFRYSHALPNGARRWDFTWHFKGPTKMAEVEFIVNHELLTTKDNCWLNMTLSKGDKFEVHIIVNKDGSVHR